MTEIVITDSCKLKCLADMKVHCFYKSIHSDITVFVSQMVDGLKLYTFLRIDQKKYGVHSLHDATGC